MRSIPVDLQTCLDERPEDIVELLEMVDTAGNGVRMSSNGQDVYVPSGEVYLGFPGFDRSDITYEIGGRAATMDLSLAIAEGQLITPQQIERGLWRKSSVRLWIADRTNPLAQALIFKGFVGRTSTTDGVTGSLEVATLAERNVDIILPKVSPVCTYVFGAGFGTTRGCRVDVEAIAIAGAVAAVISDRLSFTASLLNPQGFDFANGAVKFTSGANIEIAGQIRLWTAGTLRVDLLRPLPYDLEIGDDFLIHPGCKRTISDCTTFDGLDFWPGYTWAPGETKGG